MEGLIRLASTLALIATAACSSEGSANAVESASRQDSVSDEAKEIVLRARAFDRADNLDSARALYEGPQSAHHWCATGCSSERLVSRGTTQRGTVIWMT